MEIKKDVACMMGRYIMCWKNEKKRGKICWEMFLCGKHFICVCFLRMYDEVIFYKNYKILLLISLWCSKILRVQKYTQQKICVHFE